MQRTVEEHAAVVNDHQALAQGLDVGQVVRGQHRRAKLTIDLAQKAADAFLE
ncbi:MAG: hypothetical protein R2748_21795 [Bryobacterales bacterium]